MNRQEFIERLNLLLQDLPEEERKEAVSYYEEYFDEAGEENIARTIEELGGPEKVAATIRENLYGSVEKDGVYTETGYRKNSTPYGWQEILNVENQEQQEQKKDPKDTSKDPFVQNISGVLLALLAVPAVAVVLAVVVVLFGVVLALIGIVAAAAVLTVALFVAGIVLAIVGIVNLIAAPFSGIMTMGFGMVLLGGGLLAIRLTVHLVGYVIPRFASWIVRQVSRLIQRRPHMG